MTTNLTQALIPADHALRYGLKDVYDWHQRTWECFPGRDGRNRDFLTRLDKMEECNYRLLIVSPVEPVRPDWAPAEPEAWKTKLIPADYFKHLRYRFQLRANPTKKVTAFAQDGKPKKNSRRAPLTRREDLVDWLSRKGEQGGFKVEADSLRVLSGRREYFDKKGTSGLHSSVDFDGCLRVTDSRKFFETFSRGIGPAKAFGFGLLVIAPIAG